jgi:choline dehydrogenase
MTWFKGHPADYDSWRDQEADGWGWEDMLPVARQVEHHILGDGPFHGAGGPMTVDFARDVNPTSLAFIAAGQQLGFPVSRDLNGSERTGFGIAQANIRDGERHSVVDGYLRPALSRPNLTVRTETPVTRILFDGRKATGVSLQSGLRASAARGVVMTARAHCAHRSC